MPHRSAILHQIDTQNLRYPTSWTKQPSTKPQECGFASAIRSTEEHRLATRYRNGGPCESGKSPQHDDSVTNLDSLRLRHIRTLALIAPITPI